MQFKQLYDIIVNQHQSLIQNSYVQFFDLSFFVLKQQDNSVIITKQLKKNSEQLKFKCRKINVDMWDLIQQQDKQHRNKLLLVFSFIDSNFIDFAFQHGFLRYDSLQQFLKLNPIIINFVLNEIQSKYKDYNQDYRRNIAIQFNNLYNSKKGVVLKNQQIINYLTYSRFWEKLGLNYFDIKKLPYDVYNQLNLVIGVENEIKANALSKLK